MRDGGDEVSDSLTLDAGEAHGAERQPDRTDEGAVCKRCDRGESSIDRRGIDLCRRCFREVARSLGFQKSPSTDGADTDSSRGEVPEGVLRGIEDVAEGRTATKRDLEDALDF